MVNLTLQSISHIDELTLGTIIRAENPQLRPQTITVMVAVAVTITVAVMLTVPVMTAVAVVIMVAPTFVLGFLASAFRIQFKTNYASFCIVKFLHLAVPATHTNQ